MAARSASRTRTALTSSSGGSSLAFASNELADVYNSLVKKYDIVSIEDPFDQDDWEAWTHLTQITKIQIVGDDLTVTNPKRIQT
ncbi:hypothetical protein JCM6882_005370 [Rhodosporidiobolus microsporus]